MENYINENCFQGKQCFLERDQIPISYFEVQESSITNQITFYALYQYTLIKGMQIHKTYHIAAIYLDEQILKS